MAPDRFEASALKVTEPQSEESLIGTAERVDLADQRFRILGRTVRFSEKTDWRQITPKELEGERVKVEGHWRHGDLFSAGSIASRKEGRERISGRIDEIEGGSESLELHVQGFRIRVSPGVQPESDVPIGTLALAPEIPRELPGAVPAGREEWVPTSVRLSDTVRFGMLFESKVEHERNDDLDESIENDETNWRASLKAQFVWTPTDNFHGLLAPKVEWTGVNEEGDPDEQDLDARINEAWGYWNDLALDGLDLQVGRMDFDDDREWLYHRKLDGARVFWRKDDLTAELSGTTVLSDGSDRDEHTDNWMASLTKGDRDRELALWVIDRRDDRSPRDWPIHFGARALGDWIPQNESWLDTSLLRGFSENVDLESWAFDLGTTWSPPLTDPFSFTAGWALASGDDPSTTVTDEGFRQTGLQRNNGKFAGVTSFKYYGEVLDPELSNLSVLTLGVGVRPWRRTSVDLVWHEFRQLETADSMRNTNLHAQPDGLHDDLGREIDLVLGTKIVRGWDFEVVFGRFDPGDAFPSGDPAWLGTVQMRFRF